jgi:hypothetical protein
MRLSRLLVLPVVTVALLALVASASATPVHAWHTCVSQATLRVGIYQYDNDLFAGRRGPSCITVADERMSIDRNYAAQPGGVVAYPADRVGTYAYNRDPHSGLPRQVGKVKLSLRLRDTGNAPGHWITDVDVWFGRPGKPADHIREMIIVTRWSNYTGYCDPANVRIGTRWWHYGMCWTGSNGHSWPLIRFIGRRQVNLITLDLAAFLHVARHHDWITDGMVVSSVSDGTECWSGCRGLTDGMRVSL